MGEKWEEGDGERVRRVREEWENKMREEMREGEREERERREGEREESEGGMGEQNEGRDERGGERREMEKEGTERSMFCVIHSRTSC